MLRFGVVGFGLIGKTHAANLADGKIRGGQLVAVCTRHPPAVDLPDGVRHFDSIDAMLDAEVVDAVIVATPHPSHRAIGEKVLERGLHLLVEKPLTATKLEAERLLAVPRREGQQFCVMFHLRTDPQMQRLRRLVRDGELGTFQRVNWTNTSWYRSEAYFDAGEWRGTWKHDGGGALMNQAMHNLDLLQWICGMPTSLRADCRFGADHDVEVEDRVTAILEYPGGADSVFVTATGEAPGVNRLEIAGTGGLAVLESGVLTVWRNEVDAREYSESTNNAFGSPPCDKEVYPEEGEFTSHVGVVNNFVEAVNGEAPLLADAAEGLHSVELANAMVYSAWTQAPVTLPLDSAAYEAALEEKIATSPPRKRKVREVVLDLESSYS